MRRVETSPTGGLGGRSKARSKTSSCGAVTTDPEAERELLLAKAPVRYAGERALASVGREAYSNQSVSLGKRAGQEECVTSQRSSPNHHNLKPRPAGGLGNLSKRGPESPAGQSATSTLSHGIIAYSMSQRHREIGVRVLWEHRRRWCYAW